MANKINTSTLRTLLKVAGLNASKDAVEKFGTMLVAHATDIANVAAEKAKAAGRKTIKASDLE